MTVVSDDESALAFVRMKSEPECDGEVSEPECVEEVSEPEYGGEESQALEDAPELFVSTIGARRQRQAAATFDA